MGYPGKSVTEVRATVLKGVLHHRQDIGVETPACTAPAAAPPPRCSGCRCQRHKHIRQLRQRLHQLQKFPALQPHPGVYADIVLGLAGDTLSVVVPSISSGQR